MPNTDDTSEIVLHFSSNSSGQTDLLARCEVDHPFFVKDKGIRMYKLHNLLIIQVTLFTYSHVTESCACSGHM